MLELTVNVTVTAPVEVLPGGDREVAHRLLQQEAPHGGRRVLRRSARVTPASAAAAAAAAAVGGGGSGGARRWCALNHGPHVVD